MLYLIDGVPGAGKTLNTIKMVHERATKEHRTVYYNHIDGLSPALGWVELSDDEVKRFWEILSPSDILVVDECWRIWPKVRSGQEPEHYKKLAEHRHDGIDLYIITQSFNAQIDTFVTTMAEAHYHYQRVAGATITKRYEWSEFANPRSRADKADARCVVVPFDKKFFDKYNSAEAHTGKARLPVKFLSACALLVFLVGYLVYTIFTFSMDDIAISDKLTDQEIQSLEQDTKPESIPLQSTPAPIQQSKSSAHTWEPTDYKPRVRDVIYSAPAYDHLTKPVAAPRVAACMRSESDAACNCFTQQGTKADVSPVFCDDFIKNPPFNPWLRDEIQTQAQYPNPQNQPQNSVTAR